ncbi:hypothetical protein [Streptomyces violaceusniger]|uniref:hypothetical protein n=1 Tax=Streptomyces violaceusniger TaxID=68280 RepID=UPI00382D592E
MTASTPAGRIRAYLDALPNAVNLGVEVAYSSRFRSATWPLDAYALGREDLEQVLADANAHTEAPVFRRCLYPACLREYDAAAWMSGKEPARASWSGKGWRQVRPTIDTGYVCPEHAQAVEEHAPRWAERTEQGAVLTCACSWASPTARWPRYAVAAWQNHLLETGAAA